MMQSQHFQPSFLYYDEVDSPNSDMCNFIQNNASSDTFYTDCMNFQVQVNKLDESLLSDDFSLDFEGLDSIVTDDKIVNMSGISQATNTSYDSSMDVTTVQESLAFPMKDEERDNQESIFVLLIAYLEAMEAKQIALAEVVVKRLNEKLSLLGGSLERVLYYAFRPLEKQMDYLMVESIKNFRAAFKAFYQIFPYGKFAHFVANSAILEAMPCDAKIVHVVDFDIGNGVQWAPMIEAIGRQQRELRLTSIKWSTGHQWRFEDTKNQLYDHARDFGVKLKVDEMEIHELCREIKKGNERKWFAFNCMESLPHMGRARSRKDVMGFLKVANEFLRYNKGVITFGDGDIREKVKTSSSFSSFLNENLVHYQCLLESIEYSFPIQLKEARIAMECLFVAPFVSSLAWTHQKWDEREECRNFQFPFVMDGLKVSEESVMEAKEMVREGESLYSVRIEGNDHLANNEMVLEWRNNPLVRVSCWRS